MGFSRQEHWSGYFSPLPSPGDLPDPGIEPRSPALQADALPSEPKPPHNVVEFGSDDDDDEGFLRSSAGKKSACNAGDPGSIPGLGRPPGEGIGYPLQYSGPENSIDCIVHEVANSQTQLSNFHFGRKR